MRLDYQVSLKSPPDLTGWIRPWSNTIFSRHYCTSHDALTLFTGSQVYEQANIWWCKGFCPNFPKLDRKNSGPLFVRIFSRDDLQKRGLHVILHTLGAISAPILREFAQIFMDFVQVLTRFPWIFTKSKPLGLHFHPRLLHNWKFNRMKCLVLCSDPRNRSVFLKTHPFFPTQPQALRSRTWVKRSYTLRPWIVPNHLWLCELRCFVKNLFVTSYLW